MNMWNLYNDGTKWNAKYMFKHSWKIFDTLSIERQIYALNLWIWITTPLCLMEGSKGDATWPQRLQRHASSILVSRKLGLGSLSLHMTLTILGHICDRGHEHLTRHVSCEWNFLDATDQFPTAEYQWPSSIDAIKSRICQYWPVQILDPENHELW